MPCPRLRPGGKTLHCRAVDVLSGGSPMNYIDAGLAPLRKTGQIKLHGADAFEHMRKAGRLVAECLDMLVGEVKPGVSTERIDQLVLQFALDHNAIPATMMYRGYRKATRSEEHTSELQSQSN